MCFLPHSIYVCISTTPLDYGYFSIALAVVPTAEELALLHVPAKDLLVCTNKSIPGTTALARASKRIAILGPYDVGSGRVDKAECGRLRILSGRKSELAAMSYILAGQ